MNEDAWCNQCYTTLPDHKTWCQYYRQIPESLGLPTKAWNLGDDPLPKPELGANAIQIGGEHYKNPIQHWDWAASNNLDYFQGQITKYVARWKLKNGIEDLKKAQHFLAKYLELQEK